MPSSSARPFQLVEKRVRIVFGQRYRGEGDVFHDLDINTAHPDHQHGAESLVAVYTQDNFLTLVRHLLHQHAPDIRSRPVDAGIGR